MKKEDMKFDFISLIYITVTRGSIVKIAQGQDHSIITIEYTKTAHKKYMTNYYP